MKICLITKECFPFYYGGIGSTFYAFGKILSGLGHQVVLLSKKPAHSDQVNTAAYYTDSFQIEWIEYVEGQFFTHNALDYSFQVEKHFEQFNKEFNADLVLIPEFDGEGFFLNKEKAVHNKYPSVKFVTHFSGPLFALYEAVGKKYGLYEKIIFKMEEYSIRSSAFSIAPSSFIWKYLNNRFKLTAQKNFIYPNPVNPDAFPQPVTNAMTEQANRNILFIGRLQDIKGPDVLIQAFEKVHQSVPGIQTKLQFIGADLYWEEYAATFTEHWKARLDPEVLSKIEFTGVLSHREISDYLSQAWVAVFPSRFETFGNVALEAMYAGVPVIVNNNVGLSAAIGKKYGIYWEDNESVEGLAEKLKLVLSDTVLHAGLQKKSFDRATELHANKEEAISSVLNQLTAAAQPDSAYTGLQSISDELFYLTNEYSAIVAKEKESRSEKDLKTAWTEHDRKNEELKELYVKHEEEIKNAWAKYDEKDIQLAEVWKRHDEKEISLNETATQYARMKDSFELLSNEIKSLEQGIKNIPGQKNDNRDGGTVLLIKEKWPEISSIHNLFLMQNADNKSLKDRIELLWDDLKKEQHESGMLRKNIEALNRSLESKESEVRKVTEELSSCKTQLSALENLLQDTRQQLSAIENSEAYSTCLKLQQRKLLWKLLKKLSG